MTDSPEDGDGGFEHEAAHVDAQRGLFDDVTLPLGCRGGG